MKLMRIKLAALLLLFVIPITLSAQKVSLKVGDKAPDFKPAQWLKGTAFPNNQKGKVQLIEFTGLSCSPCIKAIPILSDLYKKYGQQLHFASIYVNGKKLEDVKRNIKNHEAAIAYPVAIDDAAGNMTKAWQHASGNLGIPTTYIIDQQGHLAWIGSPLDSNIEPVLSSIIDGTFNGNAEAEKQANEEARYSRIFTKIQYSTNTGKNVPEALQLLDSLAAKGFENLFAKYELLLKNSREQEAYDIVEKILSGEYKSRPGLGYYLYSFINAAHLLKQPDYNLFLSLAQKCYEEGDESYAYLLLADKAKVYYLKGDLDRAIDIQLASIRDFDNLKLEKDAKHRIELQQILAWYRRCKTIASIDQLSAYQSSLDTLFMHSKLSYQGLKYRKIPKGIELSNTVLTELYLYAYTGKEQYIEFLDPLYGKVHNKAILEIKDPEAIKPNYTTHKNIFNYRLKLRDTVSDSVLRKKIQSDLTKIFGYEGIVEMREQSTWDLVLLDKSKLHKSVEGVKFDFQNADGQLLFSKADIKDVLYILNNSLKDQKDFRIPLIDKTGIGFPIDLNLQGNVADLSTLKAELNKNGLDLVKRTTAMKTLIIRDAKL